MGYTHYWRAGTRPFNDVEWGRVCHGVTALLAMAPVKAIPLVGFEDEPGSPVQITPDHIRFNGVGEDSHETFLLEPKLDDFQFCKTACKPYDPVVCAVLAIAYHIAPECIRVSSDGEPSDWAEGVAWASGALGEAVKVPLNDDE